MRFKKSEICSTDSLEVYVSDSHIENEDGILLEECKTEINKKDNVITCYKFNEDIGDYEITYSDSFPENYSYKDLVRFLKSIYRVKFLNPTRKVEEKKKQSGNKTRLTKLIDEKELKRLLEDNPNKILTIYKHEKNYIVNGHEYKFKQADEKLFQKYTDRWGNSCFASVASIELIKKFGIRVIPDHIYQIDGYHKTLYFDPLEKVINEKSYSCFPLDIDRYVKVSDLHYYKWESFREILLNGVNPIDIPIKDDKEDE